MIRPPLRILIADDHAIIRVGLTSLLTNEEDMEIVAETENGEEAIDLYRTHLPDVAVFDVRMPVMGGSLQENLVKGGWAHPMGVSIESSTMIDKY